MPSPFFKCYPSDFLNGVAELTPHALAVYTICMMRMYDEDGPIPDDPVKIARRCNMRLPACEKALEELDSAAKIVRVDGKIINPRVQQEVQKRREMSAKQARNARGTDTRPPNSEHEEPEYDNKINGSAQPTVSQTDATSEPTRSQKLEARKKEDIVKTDNSQTVEIKSAIRVYNDICGGAKLPKVSKLTDARKTGVRARLRDCDGLEGWVDFCKKVIVCPHLIGDNDRGWKASLDFIIKEANYIKIIEGNYDPPAGAKPRKALTESEQRDMDKLQAAGHDSIEAARNGRIGR